MEPRATGEKDGPTAPGAPTRVRAAVLRSRRSVEEGLVSEEEYLLALAEREGAPYLREPPEGFLEPVTRPIPSEYMEEFLLVPFHRGSSEEKTWVAAARELDGTVRRELREVLEGPFEFAVAPRSLILELIRTLYGPDGDSELATGVRVESGDPSGLAVSDDIEDLANQPPVIRLVSFLIQEAYRKGASDIHLEAMEDELKVRYRIDGTLRDITQPPKKYQAAVLSRIKLLADLDITERRRPQDGRIRMEVDGRPIDLRISTVPTLHGESVVMRLLDRESIRIPLEKLGFRPEMLTRFRSVVERPHGIVLVTGPTGSGKTTTQYAALQRLNRPDVKIVTVEDPVEYQLEGVNQMAVHPKIGLTFARALRSILRQDPDVIMVGEMRDLETAEIAIQAALTGHLVFSTLHTNDAPSGVTRLLEMGIEAYLVSATVVAILAQRLVRTVCEGCAEEIALGEDPLARQLLGGASDGCRFRRGRGCERCDGTGFRGRTGLFELLEVDAGVREAIAAGATAERVRTLGRAAGMRTLREEGGDRVCAGTTTPEEVLRVTAEEEVS